MLSLKFGPSDRGSIKVQNSCVYFQLGHKLKEGTEHAMKGLQESIYLHLNLDINC